MKPVVTVRRTMMPLRRSNVDTDQIMPKQHLKRVERTGYGQFVFDAWRRDEDDFVMERPEYQNAGILITGPNFGSGSSREHAPWGLQDWGFEAIVAPSFADIFFNNCTKIGLLPVVLSDKEVEWLMELAEADPEAEVEIDVPTGTVRYGAEFEARFELDEFTRHRMVNGIDDIGLTLQHTEAIDAFEEARPEFRPVLS